MTCTKCAIDSIERNLSLDSEIYEDSHDYANIKYCISCSKIFLEYWVEIFDDGWKYWVQIDKVERDKLLEINIAQFPKNEIIKLIKNKQEVFCKYPSDEYKIVTGSSCMLDGPPW